ncbi:MAG: hypothetical protein ED859_10995 [Desulfuromonadales bacterium]|nr:MAG: hypothetical protein ED859_10995 [Desulfuromonadales bacterium]
MLRIFQSIFGSDTKQHNYPESLVKAAIERAVDGTDPWIRAVSGYKKKLRPAVIQTINHVIALVDALAPPLAFSSGSYGSDPKVRAFFISLEDMRKILANDRNLADFLKGPGGDSARIIALLAMEKQEKGIIGVELSGDIVIHGVPQVTVSFDGHRLLDPTDNEEETRRQLKRRAYDHLLSLALRRITFVKSEREDLARRRSLLQVKLNMLEREGWGFNEAGSTESPDIAGLEERLGQIEAQLLELGGDDRMLEKYLEILADVLNNPEEHLWSRTETLFVDRMGIKRSEAADDTPELTLNVLCNAEGRSIVAMLIALSGDELRKC